MRLRLLLPGAAMLALSAPARAADDDAQGWMTFTAAGSVSGRLMGSVEAVARWSDDQRRLYETEIIPHIGWRISDRVTIWAGYSRNDVYRGALPTVHEQRIREQLNLGLGTVAGGALAARTLLEQRFRNTGRDTGWRLRQQLKWSRPLHSGGKTALVLWHDSFIAFNATDWGQASGYNRMRNFAGLGVPVGKGVKAEIGYLNQYDFRKDEADRVAHALSLTIGYTF